MVSSTGLVIALDGYASATSGTTYGVYGKNESTSGAGVFGYSPKFGVYGYSNSSSGTGVFGSSPGIAIKGETSGTGNLTAGVNGVSNSAGKGIWGSNTSTGIGVYGEHTATSGTGYGVYGRTASTSGYAGYFEGRVHVQGTLTASSKQFKIDHPLDPANKYLNHTSVESSDMKNIYDGVVILDDKGEAVVELPAWFEALNGDFRYQLTAIGTAGPNLYIAEEVKNNRFTIAGGNPKMKVSWQVTGIRHDPYAEQNRMQVEENKPQAERGTYLYPQGYGQPATASPTYHLYGEQTPTEQATP